jgi:signal transduction histidine kinase
MSVTAASVAQTSPSSRSAPTRDPPSTLAMSAVLTLLLGALLIRGRETLTTIIKVEWGPLVFWAVLVVVLSFFPIKVEDARLTLDDPILLALALLYPPEVAALVAFLASCDLRELRGEVAFSRALFNRVQIGLSVYLAGTTFRYVSDGGLDPWPLAIIGTLAAVAAEYVANCLLVSLHAKGRLQLGFRAVVRRLTVGNAGQFLTTHLGYGSLALVLAHLFRNVGAWSVAMFLVPILVARQMLVRGQAIHVLAEKLKNRDQLLERLSDRILDERRDERLRIAGDLHDEVLQDLTKIWLSARLLEQQQDATHRSSEDLRELRHASEVSIDSLRSMIRALKGSSMGWGGLRPTLQGLVRDLRLEWKTKIRLHLPETIEAEPDNQFVAYQVVREALMNSLKHSDASLISVVLEVRDENLCVLVEDDGVGFSLDTVNTTSHFGLDLLKERVQRAGGIIEVMSGENEGTKVRAIFPLRPT